MSEIKPCPSGCTTAAMMLNAADGWHVRYVQCGCGWRSQEFVAREPGWAETKAIAAWNTRTPDPSLLAGLREAKGALAGICRIADQFCDEGGLNLDGMPHTRDARATLAHLDTLLSQEGES